MVTFLGREVDIIGTLLAGVLIVSLLHYIINWKRKGNWYKAITFGFMVVAILDLILLIMASITFFVFNYFPAWIPNTIIKIALFTSILFTIDFIRKSYKGFKRGRSKEKGKQKKELIKRKLIFPKSKW